MIDIQGIIKLFGSLQVLKGVDLHVDKGEAASIMGPSGTGRTTLLQIIGTPDQPNDEQVKANDILLNGLPSDKLSDFCNRHIGLMFQFHQLLLEPTVLKNVLIPTYIAGKGQGEVRERVQKLLGFIGLADRVHHRPSQLPGGEKQRVAVACALVNRSAAILADGLSGSPDSEDKAELYRLSFDLRDEFGQTFVIVTHDGGLVALIDRTIYMRNSRLIEPQTMDIKSAENKE